MDTVNMETNAEKPKMKWYLKPVMVLLWIFVAGPFALPLVWMSPAFKKWHKVVMTILLALLTVWMLNAGVTLYQTLKADMLRLQDVLK